MTIDNQTLGLLLFYTAGGLLLLSMAILYLGSVLEKRKPAKHR